MHDTVGCLNYTRIGFAFESDQLRRPITTIVLFQKKKVPSKFCDKLEKNIVVRQAISDDLYFSLMCYKTLFGDAFENNTDLIITMRYVNLAYSKWEE